MWFIMCPGLLFGDGSPMPLCCHTSTYGRREGGLRRDGGGGVQSFEKGFCVYRGGKRSWGRRRREHATSSWKRQR